MATPLNTGSPALAAPERNQFFYGKLMDVAQWKKDQRYLDLKRSLLNRVVLGSGVACGLVLEPAGPGRMSLGPGVAIDGLGREIVVATSVSVDPRALTSDAGEPTGQVVDTGHVLISLAYAESPRDLVPVLVPDCDTPGPCAPGTVREGFQILVRAAPATPPAVPGCGLGELPLAAGALHDLLNARVGDRLLDAPADPSVPLALVDVAAHTVNAAGRPLVYGNALLYELIVCLAARLDAVVNP